MIDVDDLPESVAPVEPAARVVSIPIGMSLEQVEQEGEHPTPLSSPAKRASSSCAVLCPDSQELESLGESPDREPTAPETPEREGEREVTEQIIHSKPVSPRKLT